ncbi:MAG TPA: hypothetical protein VKJ47_19190 [Candidatus Binatia bacterium]|nr:hypothetical protein [Candidatus Binatia bacterium]
MKKTTVVSLTLLSLAANLALASGGVYQAHNHEPWHDQRHHDQQHDDRTVSAPEIDPGQAMGALTLLGGAIAIVRGYRRKK